jgi:hypothetical protein
MGTENLSEDRSHKVLPQLAVTIIENNASPLKATSIFETGKKIFFQDISPEKMKGTPK